MEKQLTPSRRETVISQSLVGTRSPFMDADHLYIELTRAIDKNGLDVHYQPQFDTKANSYTHFEALIRWNHHHYGFISPVVFIPIAEEFDLIEPITHFVIARVASDLTDWQKRELPIQSVAVNISAKLLSDPVRAQQLIDRLIPVVSFARSIVLELTETAMIQDRQVARACMAKLRSLGFRIALDDFGTGHSSLTHLLEFPIDVVKIDRSFVSALPYSTKCAAIVQSLVSLGDSIGIEIVAEGVEIAEELQSVAKLGCSKIQGYYFSKPLPKSQITQLLSENRVA